MSRRSVKNFITDKLTLALSPVPATPTYPYFAGTGAFVAVGFTTSTTSVFSDRPVQNIQVETKSAIIINIVRETQEQKTGQGAYGHILKSHFVELDILWMADYSGEGGGINATFTTQSQSDIIFDKLLKAVERTLNLLMYVYTASNNIEAQHWKIIDPVDGEETRIIAEQPLVTTIVTGPERGENGLDLLYSARVACQLKESYPTAVRT